MLKVCTIFITVAGVSRTARESVGGWLASCKDRFMTSRWPSFCGYYLYLTSVSSKLANAIIFSDGK